MLARIFELLFGLRQRVTRGRYLAAGLPLAAIKFGVDSLVVYAFTGHGYQPLGYLFPSATLRAKGLGEAVPQSMYAVLVVVAMPFLWIGLSMSVRRAIDAGLSPWLGAGFLVPILNYVTIAALSMFPSRAGGLWQPHTAPEIGPYRDGGPAPSEAPPVSLPVPIPSDVRAALFGVLAAVSLGIGMIGLSVYGLGAYGMALFFATPFAMGASSAYVFNAAGLKPLGKTIGLAVIGTLLTGSIVLLFAIEGVLCLAMAFPISCTLAVFGALIGRAFADKGLASSRRTPAAFLLLLPALAYGEARTQEPTLHHVTTSIEIDAPPEAVWPNVIGFSELPAPPSFVYELGIAYPVRARIQGSGVGAVRHCEFSTGPFVEPITVWDPPRRLAFDVTSQPPSMTEWSPYRKINAPHVEGYMVSKGGEFDLQPLPGGRTRLVGTTHYTLAIYPEIYWVIYGEGLLHGIHRRVLEHIKHLSEG